MKWLNRSLGPFLLVTVVVRWLVAVFILLTAAGPRARLGGWRFRIRNMKFLIRWIGGTLLAIIGSLPRPLR
jgi:hypothetical protein